MPSCMPSCVFSFQERGTFPKFLGQHGDRQNKTQRPPPYILEENGLPYVKLPKVGKIRFVLPKGQTIASIIPEGTAILSAVVRRETNHHTVSLQLETVIPKPEQLMEMHVGDILAADMGFKRFAVIGGSDSTLRPLRCLQRSALAAVVSNN